jgi:uncharacterized protein YbjT (DUF2867 family)
MRGFEAPHPRQRRRLLTLLAAGGLALASLPGAAGTPTDSPAAPRQVLVLGGTGQLGAEIVQRLNAAGHRVTVFVRATSNRERLAGLPVEFAVGDLFDEASVAGVLRAKRYDVVVSALRVEDGDVHFYEKALTPLTKQAKANGVGQVIHHGAVGAGANAAKFTRLGWERVPGLLDRLRDQGIGEDLLRGSGVPFTIIRNARIYADGTPSTGRAELTEDDSVITPMTRADLAIFTLHCLANPDCYGKVYHVRDESLAWPPPRPPT